MIDPQATLNPTSIWFGTVTKNTTLTELVTLKNTGTTTLSNIVLTMTGTNAAEFKVSPATTCGATLASGKSCVIAIAFKPVAAASYSATLVVTDNAQCSTQKVGLGGKGQ